MRVQNWFMKTTILATFKNDEMGIQTTVAAYHKGGFSVALKDTDADEFLGIAPIFKTFEEATAYAEKAVV